MFKNNYFLWILFCRWLRWREIIPIIRKFQCHYPSQLAFLRSFFDPSISNMEYIDRWLFSLILKYCNFFTNISSSFWDFMILFSYRSAPETKFTYSFKLSNSSDCENVLRIKFSFTKEGLNAINFNANTRSKCKLTKSISLTGMK